MERPYDNLDMYEHENVLEFLYNQKVATVTISQPRLKNKIMELKEEFPDDVEIVADNENSLLAHIPSSWIKIVPPRKREISDEQREELRERLKKYRDKKEKEKCKDDENIEQ